jgi:hypothetical protein
MREHTYQLRCAHPNYLILCNKLRIIPCFSSCARESTKRLPALRTATAASRSVEFSLEPHPTRWGGNKLQAPPGGACQSGLCPFENGTLATEDGIKALEAGLSRSADTLLRGRNKSRPIRDVDSTGDPVHGKQEGAAIPGKE